MSNEAHVVYRHSGYCPICEAPAEFTARYGWYRDHLLCSGCGSIPRERAVALILDRRFPDWRELAIHESSPGTRGVSPKLKRECSGYVESQFFRGEPLGKMINGFRNENLEVQTFPEGTFDVVVTQDVMEHVNEPQDVLNEVARSLKEGGAFIFTAPTYKEQVKSERRARYQDDGGIEHFADPEYHGNPIGDTGSLVTFRYGYDFAELIGQWSEMDVEVVRFHDRHHGIIGEFTEVYVAVKRGGTSTRKSATIGEIDGLAADRWPSDVRAMCQTSASQFDVAHEVHKEDFIFRFVYDHPGFESKNKAIDYYFSDGAKSAAKVRRHVDKWLNTPGTALNILEFAAGYGAVTRHATKALAPHTLHSSDIHPQANRFLSDVLSVASVQSAEAPEELVLPTSYDVIFVLSFFSHMPRTSWLRWLQRLYAGLAEGGVLLFTTHGRTSMKFFPKAKLDQAGFWFDASSEQGDLTTATYGQTITSKEFVDAQIAQLPGAQYLDYESAGWWDHQDVYIVRKG